MNQQPLKVLSNRKITDGHYILELESSDISLQARPGQFVQIIADDSYEPFLPRPFSFLDVGKGRFRILYQVIGKGTELLAARKKGESLKVIGPLGNGFSYDSERETVLVGGGVGIPPLYHLAMYIKKETRGKRDKGQGTGDRGQGTGDKGQGTRKIQVFLGGRSKDLLHCENDFKRIGAAVSISTDDGSKGHKGLVTDILDRYLSSLPTSNFQLSPALYSCGPTAMLKAVTQVAQKHNLPCQVSIEECMPCGFGACLGCAVKVRAQGGEGGMGNREEGQADVDGYRYAIGCTEGPVFEGDKIIWQ